jgi:hypothetical protein
MASLLIAPEALEAVSGRDSKVDQRKGGMQGVELPPDEWPENPGEASGDSIVLPVEDPLGGRIVERSDHRPIIHEYRVCGEPPPEGGDRRVLLG